MGVWEYDPKTEMVVTRVWRTDRRLKERAAEAAVDTGRFIREQLGDAKLSMTSGKSSEPKARSQKP